MRAATERVLALGGEVHHTPVGRYETDYYLQRVAVATCSIAATLALVIALIPTSSGVGQPPAPPGSGGTVVEFDHFVPEPPSVSQGPQPVPTIKEPDVIFPIPTPDDQLWDEEPVVAFDGGGNGNALPPLDGVDGGTGSGTVSGIAPVIIDPPDVFLFVEVAPELVSMQEPAYPELARDAGVEGSVFVKVLVSEEGFVLDAVLMEGVPLLSEAAVEAAHTAIFKPAQQSGQPVRTWVVVPIEFNLRS